jgi:5-hydroxyisourate hydrolase-like protein (transthyretin family)
MSKLRALRPSAAIWAAVVTVILWLAAIFWGLPALTSSQVSGKVTDSQTGKPIAHSIVVIARRASTLHGASARRAQIAETQTDLQGRFTATLQSTNLQMLSSSYQLIVIAHGYRPLSVRLAYPTPDWAIENGDPPLSLENFPVQLHAMQSLGVQEAFSTVRSDLYDLYFAIPVVCAVREVPRLWIYLVKNGIFEPVNASSEKQDEQGKHCEKLESPIRRALGYGDAGEAAADA